MSKFVLLLVLLGLSFAFPQKNSFLSSYIKLAATPRKANFYVMSDTENWATPKGGNSDKAVAATVVSGWTASIPGAKWIWTSATATEVLFTNWFSVPGTVNKAVLHLAADNDVVTYLNGKTVACNKKDSYTATVKCDLTAHVQSGINQIEFWVTNTGGPAGLLYKLVVNASLEW
jgi:hypothetical protein